MVRASWHEQVGLKWTGREETEREGCVSEDREAVVYQKMSDFWHRHGSDGQGFFGTTGSMAA